MTDPLAARFEALLEPGTPDWLDVHRRVRRRSRRIWLIAAVAAVFLAIPTVAIALDPTILPWTSAKPAPAPVVHNFATFGLGAPRGMDPHVLAGEARRIMTARFNGRLNTLYVAPTKSGGFCELWTDRGGGFGGCVPAKTPSTFGSGPLRLDLLGPGGLVHGWVRLGATRTLEARFADGTTTTIPARDVTWVSAPINAGFVAYPVPRSHRDRAHALRSVVALDADGRVIGRVSAPPPRRKTRSPWVRHTLPDGTQAFFPRGAGAEAAKARKIISFRTTDPFVAPTRPAHRSRVYVWRIPIAGGGHCLITNGARGIQYPPQVCFIPRLGKHAPALHAGLEPGTRMDFFALVKPVVATVELRYQNGERERLTPLDGFVLHDITPAHWKPGTRLVAALALNQSGKTIYTQRFPHPQEPGVYPCKKPINHICP
ncbi:MAG TPA: hypothetical protein VNF91_03275 [Candidatus Acidoferrum sp.]|nr:hypothetical protein [Candidatus Acidoferrum sp.]